MITRFSLNYVPISLAKVYMEALFLIAAGEGTRQLRGCGHRQGEKTENARSVCVCPFWGTLGASV